MPTTITSISPFYDDDSVAPPPFPPMLTDQLELFGSGCGQHSSSLLAEEVLSSATRIIAPAKVTPVLERPQTQKSAVLAPEFKLAARSPKPGTRTASPYPKKSPKQPHTHFRDHTSPESSSELSSESSESSSDDDDSTSGTLSEDSKIPKPPGEPGRPGRGGYTLETALDWNHKTYAKLKKFTHRLIEEHLDVTKCASAQNTTLLKVVRNKAVDAFPDLENYSNYWPVNNIIMMRLKYTSGRAQRRQELEMVAGKGKKSSGRASVRRSSLGVSQSS
ncbi:hypothetical protein HYDPIDRAFT_25127 [Hydnomerulius pinastri MD-312]|nr:hypothetical protein HYDPIDRAFT_25127 [Hydnomerulius pinastri MD-312]